MRQINNLHEIEGVSLSSFHQFPILNPYVGVCEWANAIPFSHRNSYKGDKAMTAVHFFEQDCCFNSIWRNLDKSVFSLRDYLVVFAPDFSLYVDAPLPLNQFAVYQSRLCGAFMQLRGYNVIPTYSYSDASSLDWSLEGLPSNSILGTCGTGLKQSSISLRLFRYALRRVEEELSPIMIYVYGDPVDLPGITTEVRFIETHISKFLRK